MKKELLQVLQDVRLVDKGKLHIHLGEFRLTVSAQILIPEASGHLVIFIDAAYHKQLLEDLRRLG